MVPEAGYYFRGIRTGKNSLLKFVNKWKKRKKHDTIRMFSFDIIKILRGYAAWGGMLYDGKRVSEEKCL